MSNQHPIGKDGLAIRESGLWAEDKLHYLGRYLKIMSVGMKKKWPDLYYVDLFAGPGRCLLRENSNEIDGSPLIALLGFKFSEYYFFEAEPACYEALEKRIKQRAPAKQELVKLIPGDCNDNISKVTPSPSSLGLAFIDPTGISQLSFETVKKLTENRKIDLIINFPEGMGIRMNLHHYDRKEKSALNRFMGSSRWQELYTQKLTSFDQICRAIAAEYLENLRSIGYLALDGDWIPVKTNQNVLLYYLLFASKHPTGNDFWRKINTIDRHGQRKLEFR